MRLLEYLPSNSNIHLLNGQLLFFWFQKCTIRSESLPWYWSKLDFKYFEIILFCVTALVFLIPELLSPRAFQDIYIENQILWNPTAQWWAIVLLVSEMHNYSVFFTHTKIDMRAFKDIVGIQILWNHIVSCHSNSSSYSRTVWLISTFEKLICLRTFQDIYQSWNSKHLEILK